MGLCLKVTSRPQYHLGGGMILPSVFVLVSSLLLAVVSHVAEGQREAHPPSTPPRTLPPSLFTCLLNLRGSVWSPLLKTAYFCFLFFQCVKVCEMTSISVES